MTDIGEPQGRPEEQDRRARSPHIEILPGELLGPNFDRLFRDPNSGCIGKIVIGPDPSGIMKGDCIIFYQIRIDQHGVRYVVPGVSQRAPWSKRTELTRREINRTLEVLRDDVLVVPDATGSTERNGMGSRVLVFSKNT